MKLGPVEGTHEEVINFFENNGLNIQDYFQKPKPELAVTWLITPALIIVISFITLSLLGIGYDELKIILFSIGFSSSVWLAVSVHIRFKTSWGAGAIVLAGLLIMLIALGVLKPEQMTKYYNVENTDKTQVNPKQ